MIIKRNLEQMMSKQREKSRQGVEAQSASHGACKRLSCEYGTTNTLNMDLIRLASRVCQAIVLNCALLCALFGHFTGAIEISSQSHWTPLI
jgi:hypothetical protein